MAPSFRVFEKLVDLLVGEPPPALDRRAVHLGRHPEPLGRELDEYRLGIPDFPRLQAGQGVGDQLGEHGQHAVGQVDARRPPVRLPVQGRLRPDEVPHVGDVHAEPPVPIGQSLQ